MNRGSEEGGSFNFVVYFVLGTLSAFVLAILWKLLTAPTPTPTKCRAVIDRQRPVRYCPLMNAIGFVTELKGTAVLDIPREIAAQLPKAGRARIIVLTEAPNAAFFCWRGSRPASRSLSD